MASNNANNINSIDEIVLNGVLKMIDKKSEWTGTMTQLNSQLSKQMGKSATLPGSPSALRVVLNRVVNRLRARKVSVNFHRTTDHQRKRVVEFRTKA